MLSSRSGYRLLSLVLGVILLTPSLWGGVSRVGTASIQFEKSDYSVKLPRVLKSYELKGEETVRFYASELNPLRRMQAPFRGRGMTTVVDMHQLFERFPTLAGKTRSEFREHFKAMKWVKIDAKNPCFEVFQGQSKTAVYTAVAWSSSKGFLVVGTKGSTAEHITRGLIETTLVHSGGCEWE